MLTVVIQVDMILNYMFRLRLRGNVSIEVPQIHYVLARRARQLKRGVSYFYKDISLEVQDET